MKKLLLVTLFIQISLVSFSQMSVSRTKGAESKVLRIENIVSATSKRRDLLSKDEIYTGKSELTSSNTELHNSYYLDIATKKVLQINQRFTKKKYEVVGYHFLNDILIKATIYVYDGGSIVLEGEYYFEDGKVIQARERNELIDSNKLIQEAKTLLERAYSKHQIKT